MKKKYIVLICVMIIVAALISGIIFYMNNRLPDTIGLSIKKGTLTNTSATLVLKGKKLSEYIFYEDYKIEKKINNEWEKVSKIPPKIAGLLNTGEMVFWVAEEGTNIHEYPINWLYEYGELEPGEYRIVMEHGLEVEFKID